MDPADYPKLDVRWGDDGEPIFRTITRWDVARACFGRCIFFGMRDPSDPFIGYEMDCALLMAGFP